MVFLIPKLNGARRRTRSLRRRCQRRHTPEALESTYQTPAQSTNAGRLKGSRLLRLSPDEDGDRPPLFTHVWRGLAGPDSDGCKTRGRSPTWLIAPFWDSRPSHRYLPRHSSSWTDPLPRRLQDGATERRPLAERRAPGYWALPEQRKRNFAGSNGDTPEQPPHTRQRFWTPGAAPCRT